MRSIDQTTHDLVITDADLERLRPVLDQHDTEAATLLETELQRAVIVAAHDVPADVVTMNSEVVYEDCDTTTCRRVRVVYPKDANPSEGRVSVLAPIGSALLGLRVGQAIEWVVPTGTKRIRVVELPYQPEASGDFGR